MTPPSTPSSPGRAPASRATPPILALALPLALLAAPASTQTHRLVSSTVAGGGGTVSGATHRLHGSVGQAIAGPPVTAGAHRLTAGFLPVAARSAPSADLSLTKTDDLTTAIPGQALTYTLVVGNAGPAAVVGARVFDDLPGALLGATWSCEPSPGASCTAAGAGSLDETVDLAAGSNVTFRLIATVDAAATGKLVNTASVSVPDGVVDPDSTNDAATDADTLLPTADLQITKEDGRSETAPGSIVTYTIRARNAGPSHAAGALVSDVLPPDLASCAWSCSFAAGASCGAPPSGDLSESVSLPPGEEIVYTGSCVVAAAAAGTIENTATISPPAGVTDPVPANDSATDSTTVVPDLWLFTDGFESGDLTAWSSAAGQALLLAEAEDSAHYLQRLAIDPSLLRRIGRQDLNGDEILAGLGPEARRLFSLRLRSRAGELELGVRVRDGDERAGGLSWRPIHRDPRELEVEWRRSLQGLDDGVLFVSVDGDLVHWSVDLANHRQELVHIGVAQDRGRELLVRSSAPVE